MLANKVLSRTWAFLAIGMLILASGCTSGLGGSQPATKSVEEPRANTAREAYPLAERVARAWKSDAELRSVRATWQSPSQAQLREGKAAWAFYFVSRSTKLGSKMAGYVVSVKEAEARGEREEQFTAAAKSIIFVDWKIDSGQALKAFLDNGGQDFLAAHAQADLVAILHNVGGADPLVWQTVALDRQTKATLSVQVDAFSGVAIRKP